MLELDRTTRKAYDHCAHRAINDAKQNGREHDSDHEPNPKEAKKQIYFHWHSSWSVKKKQEHGIKHSREGYKDWVTKVRQSMSL